ncbi:MAG: L,D-transpeptidase family protein [Verrucomicrobiales bacterium]|nr:L,D-transpeptidase [Verrucomicrobiota bacterium JB025]
MKSGRRLIVDVDRQTLELFEGGSPVRTFEVSTSAWGVGSREGSFRTPLGKFRICEKIGSGAEAGTVFKSREPAGVWTPGDGAEGDMILSRILRLEGLEDGNANTYDRYVYIHGTNDEERIGTPVSHGCVRLRNADVIELFDLVEVGDLLEIPAPTRVCGKLCFISGDMKRAGAYKCGCPELFETLRSGGWRLVFVISETDREFAAAEEADEVEILKQSSMVEDVLDDWIEALRPERAVFLEVLGEAGEVLVRDVRPGCGGEGAGLERRVDLAGIGEFGEELGRL